MLQKHRRELWAFGHHQQQKRGDFIFRRSDCRSGSWWCERHKRERKDTTRWNIIKIFVNYSNQQSHKKDPAHIHTYQKKCESVWVFRRAMYVYVCKQHARFRENDNASRGAHFCRVEFSAFAHFKWRTVTRGELTSARGDVYRRARTGYIRGLPNIIEIGISQNIAFTEKTQE